MNSWVIILYDLGALSLSLAFGLGVARAYGSVVFPWPTDPPVLRESKRRIRFARYREGVLTDPDELTIALDRAARQKEINVATLGLPVCQIAGALLAYLFILKRAPWDTNLSAGWFVYFAALTAVGSVAVTRKRKRLLGRSIPRLRAMLDERQIVARAPDRPDTAEQSE